MIRSHTTTLKGVYELRQVFLSADCQEDFEDRWFPWVGLFSLLKLHLIYAVGIVASPVTSLSDIWFEDIRKEVSTTSEPRKRLLVISDLGWTPEEALATYHRLQAFQDDWNVPGMELYDEL